MSNSIAVIKDIFVVNQASYISPHFISHTKMVNWFEKYATFNNHPFKWKLNVMYQALCEFDEVIQLCITHAMSANYHRPKAITDFETYMTGVREAKDFHKVNSVRICKGQISQQKADKLQTSRS